MSVQGAKCAVAALVIVAVAACGGGGEGGNSSLSSSPTVTPAAVNPCATTSAVAAVHADFSVAAGKTAGATLVGCSGRISEVEWTQLDGPAVELYTARSQAITFDANEPGRYRFRADYKTASGTAGAIDVTITADAASRPSALNARNDQAVRSEGQFSIRAYWNLEAGDTVRRVEWTQTAGPPAAKVDVTLPERLLVTAPKVSSDTILVFEATLTSANGVVDRDQAIVIVEAFPQADPRDSSYTFATVHVDRVYPYRRGGKYEAVLVECAYHPKLRFVAVGNSANTLCPVSKLPFLAQEAADGVPTVDQIMARVAVSHDWMGARFEEYLRNGDSSLDIRRMLGAVTAIVLTSHTRPSFYRRGLAAIDIDAGVLWRTPAERDTVGETLDARANSSNELSYRRVSRYVTGGQNAFGDYPRQDRGVRSNAHLLASIEKDLYHELTHARDYFAPIPQFFPAKSAWEHIFPLREQKRLASDQLHASAPLQSKILADLALVYHSFSGTPKATPAQKAYTPLDVAEFFAADVANDHYNFYAYNVSGPNGGIEDTAMLVEELMMAVRHGARRDIAFVDAYPVATATPDEVAALAVRWGQRGRIGADPIKVRAQLVIGHTMPWRDVQIVDALPAPIPLRVNDTWGANIIQP